MDGIPYWASLLIYQTPALVVALVGAILSLTNMKRCSSASMMTLLGCGLLGLGAVIFLVVRVLLFEEMRGGNMANKRYAEISMLVGIASSLTYGLALGLIVLAVFTGRKPLSDSRRDARPNPRPDF